MRKINLSPDEARGAAWEDYSGETLTVKRSVWRRHTTDRKTASAAKPVLVIQPLRERLAELREAEGNPANGLIPPGEKGAPLSLDMLAHVVIRPALHTRSELRQSEAKDWKPLEWQASIRSGAVSQRSLTAITCHPVAAKGLLRRSSVNTTLALHEERARSHSKPNDAS